MDNCMLDIARTKELLCKCDIYKVIEMQLQSQIPVLDCRGSQVTSVSQG